MDVEAKVLQVLDEVEPGARAKAFKRDSQLLIAVPELDSMAVVTLIATIEERFGMLIHDDEIDGDTFRSFGTLVDFVGAKAGS